MCDLAYSISLRISVINSYIYTCSYTFKIHIYNNLCLCHDSMSLYMYI